MIIGIPKEIKDGEKRVAITPPGVNELTRRGHKVIIEKGAGTGSDIKDEEFLRAGAELVNTAAEVYKNSEMILKVKEPLEAEYGLLQEKHILFTYLHLAANENLTRVLMEKKVAALGYETVEENGRLPLLMPMSEVAGRMSVIIGAQYLQHIYGGKGLLLSGIPGVRSAEVMVLGAGTVGINAVKVAVGLGASVTVFDINADRLRYLDDLYGSKIKTLFSNSYNIAGSLEKADLVIGAVLLPGAKAPVLISREMLKLMPQGSVIIDVAVDQGGCIETTKPTTHSNPTYFVDGVLHYCVANMPGAVPYTSTYALCNATLPYVCLIADMGLDMAIEKSKSLAKGVNVYKGKIFCKGVADAFGFPWETVIPGTI